MNLLRFYLLVFLVCCAIPAYPPLLPVGGTIWYVAQGGTDEAFRGRSPEDPLATISYALSMMESGDTCLVGPGVYHETLNITQDSISLRGVKAPVIDADGDLHACFIHNASNINIEGFEFREAKNHLINIQGTEARNIVIRGCTLREWGLNPDNRECVAGNYPAGVNICFGAGWVTIDACYFYRGNYEYIPGEKTPDFEAINFWGGSGHNLITNNVVIGVALDILPADPLPSPDSNLASYIESHALMHASDFGDGYPLYKFNLGDCFNENELPYYPDDFLRLYEEGTPITDFDDTEFSGNFLFGSHDDMIAVPGTDRNCLITDNYIDCMGAATAFSIRSASVGPLDISRNIVVNFGIDCFKYGSSPMGSGKAIKTIKDNVCYSTLARGYKDTEDGTPYYTFTLNPSTCRWLDGEVQGLSQTSYDYVTAIGNKVLCRGAFFASVPGSGDNNTLINNYFSCISPDFGPSRCVKWYGEYISLEDFNHTAGNIGGNLVADNVWQVIDRPSAPVPPEAGVRTTSAWAELLSHASNTAASSGTGQVNGSPATPSPASSSVIVSIPSNVVLAGPPAVSEEIFATAPALLASAAVLEADSFPVVFAVAVGLIISGAVLAIMLVLRRAR